MDESTEGKEKDNNNVLTKEKNVLINALSSFSISLFPGKNWKS